jgi:dTDP-4-amino-4,6-dideoxygalactose transaminase
MKFLELGLSEPCLRAELDAAYHRVMDSGWVVLGPELQAFEAEYAAYCGTRYSVGVGNGLDAITLTLRAFGIGPGDGVIVPSHTFAGTWVGVAAAGATPVPAEIDPVTYTLDPAAAVAAIRPGVKAIMPVSLYGHPADMGALMAIAKQHELVLIEDGAQGHGAAAQGRRVGGLAHATAFSFYPTKNLGAIGEAGAVTTDDPEIDRRLRMLRNYGQQQRYVHETVGVNSRLDELQAAFLRVQLARLEAGNDARRALAARYAERLSGTPGLTLPTEANWARHVHHLYVVRTAERDRLKTGLAEQGIETIVHYPLACHLQPAFAHLGHGRGAFPIAEQAAEQVLSLPLRPGLPLKAADEVAAAVRKVLG